MRISIAVMHHPKRAGSVGHLLQSCLPLRARVITDPDPYGVPSPLRTAKRAWAAIDEEATHHVVIQDDVRPAPCFATSLVELLPLRPDDAIALYVNWNSPENSYLVRRAAACGVPFAPLSLEEYTPTLGLALPVNIARRLAVHLAGLSDDLRDDDDVISVFLRENGVHLAATVPNLLDHGDGESVAGNDAHGSRHAVVPAGGLWPDVSHWQAGLAANAALRARRGRSAAREFVVEFLDSTCLIRFVRPGSGEPVEHPFGWYWLDWSELLGLSAAAVLDGWRAFLRSETAQARAVRRRLLALCGEQTLLEFWAACQLLGYDAVTTGCDAAGGLLPADTRTSLLRGALESWLVSGLRQTERDRLSQADLALLVEVGVGAVRAGSEYGEPPGLDPLVVTDGVAAGPGHSGDSHNSGGVRCG